MLAEREPLQLFYPVRRTTLKIALAFKMAETISIVPVEETEGEGVLPGSTPDVHVLSDVPVQSDVLSDVPSDVPVQPDVLPDVLSEPEPPKRTRAKAKAKVKVAKVKAEPKARAKAKVVTIREEKQEEQEPEEQEPELPLLPDGSMLQHMLNHRMRQRTQREEMYKSFVASF